MNAPEDTDPTITKAQIDPVDFNASAAVDVFNTAGNSSRLYYDGSFGETTYSHEGGLRLRIGF